MPKIQSKEALSFPTSSDLKLWLQNNHACESELWIKVYKKHTGIASVTWDEIVMEALCWGWIDSTRKSLDEQAYLQRLTPRKPQSIWSKRNTEHVERLIREGRMQDAGLVHVQAAKSDGRWNNAYRVSEISVPEDFLEALESRPQAKQFFATLPKSSRNIIAHGLSSAKRSETREKRFNHYMDMLEKQQRPR